MSNEPANCSEAWWEMKTGQTVEIEEELCECKQWVVGQNRCSCGSRRIYLTEYVDNIFGPSAD